MSGNVPERAKHPLDQSGKPPLLGLLALGDKSIDGEGWLAAGESLVDQRETIIGKPRQGAQPFSDTLGRLEDGVEVVVLQQLRPTEPEDFAVDPATVQLSTQTVGALVRLGKRLCGGNGPESTILPEGETAERQDDVHLGTKVLEFGLPIRKSNGCQYRFDKGAHIIPATVLLLPGGERQKDPFPLRISALFRDTARLKNGCALTVRNRIGDDVCDLTQY